MKGTPPETDSQTQTPRFTAGFFHARSAVGIPTASLRADSLTAARPATHAEAAAHTQCHFGEPRPFADVSPPGGYALPPSSPLETRLATHLAIPDLRAARPRRVATPRPGRTPIRAQHTSRTRHRPHSGGIPPSFGNAAPRPRPNTRTASPHAQPKPERPGAPSLDFRLTLPAPYQTPGHCSGKGLCPLDPHKEASPP